MTGPRAAPRPQADFGGAVGVALRAEQRLAMDELWAIVPLPAADARRGGLPGKEAKTRGGLKVDWIGLRRGYARPAPGPVFCGSRLAGTDGPTPARPCLPPAAAN